MNYPEGWNLSTTDTAPASVMPGSVASVFLGPIAGYNLAMLLTFVLSGWTMYLWVYHNTRNNIASVLSGTIFMVLPYRMAHFLIGHLNLSGTQWIPLLFLGLQGLIQGGMRKFQAALLAGLALGLIAFTSMYYLYMTLLIAGVFALILLIATRLRRLKESQFWLEIALFVIVALPFIYFAMRPFINLADAGVITTRDWTYINEYSASPLDYLLPSTDHFLVGQWVGDHFNRELWPEVTLFIGFASLGLLIYWLFNKNKDFSKPIVFSVLIAGLVAFIFSLGPTLHWNGRPVLTNPADPESFIYLPAYWAIHKFPFFDRMRAIARFGLYPGMFAAFISGISAAMILGRTRKRAVLFGVTLIAAVLFEFYPGSYQKDISLVEPRPIDLWLRDQQVPSPVVYFPVESNQNQFNIFATYYNGQPIYGGLFSANKPYQYQYTEEPLSHFPTEESVKILRELGFKYALVSVPSYENIAEFRPTLASMGINYVDTVGDYQIYDLGR